MGDKSHRDPAHTATAESCDRTARGIKKDNNVDVVQFARHTAWPRCREGQLERWRHGDFGGRVAASVRERTSLATAKPRGDLLVSCRCCVAYG